MLRSKRLHSPHDHLRYVLHRSYTLAPGRDRAEQTKLVRQIVDGPLTLIYQVRPDPKAWFGPLGVFPVTDFLKKTNLVTDNMKETGRD